MVIDRFVENGSQEAAAKERSSIVAVVSCSSMFRLIHVEEVDEKHPSQPSPLLRMICLNALRGTDINCCECCRSFGSTFVGQCSFQLLFLSSVFTEKKVTGRSLSFSSVKKTTASVAFLFVCFSGFVSRFKR